LNTLPRVVAIDYATGRTIEIGEFTFILSSAGVAAITLMYPWLALVTLPSLFLLFAGLITERIRVEHGALSDGTYFILSEDE
jgi:hypothetical protein